MYRLRLPSVLILILFGCGCLVKPATERSYAKGGISFSHYSDWRVTEDPPSEDDSSFPTINVEGPNEELVMFIFVPSKSATNLETFAAAFAKGRLEQLKAMKAEEVSDTTSEPITGRIGGRVQNGILQRFSIKALGQHVPHEARFFAVENTRARNKIFIVTQVATEDLHDTTPAFELILNSVSLSDK